MARLSDIIEEFIKQMFNENADTDNVVFIQRNELADQFRCAPSQINYVLTTRFTYERGYLIESKRGGGGHIAIKQLEYDNSNQREEIINQSIGDTITYHNAHALLNHLFESGVIEERECEVMKIAINDRSLASADNKNKLRADILKAMIMVILS
ncbi:CtsR family transcriptional regulator [Clostridium chromiireducens]|uniref:Transcriptional regulator CtsR n=1 Tax=Clostridium chromiireducens TaxID=225345 RepID=A0A1V4IBN4_9CLOT|nr:CtsR family transcriptional regulator [Clostridium chromiireducens]MVX66979.1 CtsR family transcriptional regulator [Clostridium chromiireducens]OPJ57412.1 transcriptional regulator CtsR [Clostridium chromiireducens]RII32622.1 CtsR family transcriptional regulator [Clostridium chromiireducens]